MIENRSGVGCALIAVCKSLWTVGDDPTVIFICSPGGKHSEQSGRFSAIALSTSIIEVPFEDKPQNIVGLLFPIAVVILPVWITIRLVKIISPIDLHNSPPILVSWRSEESPELLIGGSYFTSLDTERIALELRWQRLLAWIFQVEIRRDRRFHLSLLSRLVGSILGIA